MRRFSRRKALGVVVGLVGGVGLASCAHHDQSSVVEPPMTRQGSLRRLARVLVSPERVIRTVVGLRPFRPSGFVVRAEKLDDKLLIHNYGHGGGGVTLSWGTSQLAVEDVSSSGLSGSAAVLRCGAVGLATARLLQRHGFDVTIYARDIPPNTTSNVAGASWFPTAVVEAGRRTVRFDSQFERAARLSHRYFQELVGPKYGVHWREQYFLTDEVGPEPWEYVMLRDLFPGLWQLGRGEHPFGVRYALVDNMMFIEPPVYLAALLDDFRLAGGRLVVRAFQEARQLAALPEAVVMNCTGLGSKELFGDEELLPDKGQLTVLLPQPEVDYAMVMNDEVYMFPRQDGILLGGTHERGVSTLEPNVEAQRRIVAEHQRIFDRMR